MLLTDDPRIYVRVYGSVKNDIVTGNLAPGKPIPPITVLCQEHGGGRQTIAKALRMLEDDAWLICYPGLGYYVAPEVATVADTELAAHEEQIAGQLAAHVRALEAENERLRKHLAANATEPS